LPLNAINIKPARGVWDLEFTAIEKGGMRTEVFKGNIEVTSERTYIGDKFNADTVGHRCWLDRASFNGHDGFVVTKGINDNCNRNHCYEKVFKLENSIGDDVVEVWAWRY
jgi:hypothetical protein